MIIPVTVSDRKEIRFDAALSEVSFSSLGLREAHVEEFIRKNIELIFDEDDGDETLLIVGQQVVNKSGGRNDLVALDGNGNLVLIEIKRDAEDMTARSESMEFQAIRYAASLATIKTVDDLVEKVFARYVGKWTDEFELGGLLPEEFARRKVKEFLKENKADNSFNKHQRIILIASDFDDQTLSATAWMSENGVNISCIRIRPIKDDTKGTLFLEIKKLIPLRQVDDLFVPLREPIASGGNRLPSSQIDLKKRSLPKMAQLMEWGLVNRGDKLTIKNRDHSEAEVIDAKNVRFQNETMSFNNWGEKVTGWSKIGIYDHAMKGNQTLAALRDEKMSEEAAG